MGRLEQLRNSFKTALVYYSAADSVLKAHPNTTIQIQNLNNQGIAHRELGNYTTALTCFQQELTLQKPSDNKRGRTLKQIGETYIAMQQPDTARAYLLRAKVFREAEYGSLPHPNMAKLLKLLGDADHQQNKFQSALAWYTKAENRLRLASSPSQSRTILFPLDLLPVLQARARTYEAMHAQTGQRDALIQALATYQRADSALDLVRQSLDLKGSKLTISGQARPLFEGGIRVALLLQQLEPNAPWREQAFHFAEKNRATLLKEAVRKVDSRHLGIVPDSLWQQQRHLSLRLGNLRKDLANIAPEKIVQDTAALRLEAQLFRSQLQLDSLQDAIAQQYPDLTDFLGQNRAISAAEVLAQLGAGQSLVEYFVGDSAVYAFCLSGQGLQVDDLGAPAGLRPAIDEIRRFTDSDTVGKDGYLHSAAALYARLIAPLRGALPGQRLVVVPDGILHLLPFELLLQNADALPFRSLPYLFRAYAISYQFSCGLMHEKGQADGLAKAEISWAGFAPEFSPGRSGLPALRGAQQEVAAVAAQFGGARVYAGDAASKGAFMAALTENVPPHILHLACHAKAGSASESDAWIAFSDADSSFRLSLEEVYHLPDAPALMVLSACETGAGPLATGEGAMSLARGFYLSGSRAILNSMWQVRDGSSAYLMEAFYRGLRAGKPLDVALQQAMLAYLDSEDFGEAYMAPHFWAGFRITGAAAPLQARRSSAIWWMLFGFLATGLLYWRFQVVRFRKRQ